MSRACPPTKRPVPCSMSWNRLATSAAGGPAIDTPFREPESIPMEGTMTEHTDELKRAIVAIRDLRRQVQRLETSAREPIAIIGAACRLPGGANTPEAFWELLRDGVDATSEVPPERWNNEIGRAHV